MVPGCEPSTTVTSTTMEQQMLAAQVCNAAIVPLKRVLELIPTATVVLLQNFGGPTHKLLQLPDNWVGCPCQNYTDFYAIIRSAAEPITEDTIDDILDQSCRTVDMGWCRGTLGGN